MKSLILLLFAVPALAQEMNTPEPPPPPPHYHVQQGGIVVIPLTHSQCNGRTLEAIGRTWQCETDGRLLVGVPCDQPVGQYLLTVQDTEESEVLATVSVVEVVFDRDEKPRRERRPAVTKKRRLERAEIDHALTTGKSKYPEISLHMLWRNPLAIMQVSGDTYGMYRDNVVRRGKGKKRRVVDKWTTRHKGVDLRGPVGTPVCSPSDGVVVHAQHTSSEGKMVIVYHGSDVYTLHMHLSRMVVRKGQFVDAGQRIGATGATGAAKGPHLHYATKVGDAYVDPEAFIETINRDWGQ